MTSSKAEGLYVGAISGTSMDGLDVAVIKLGPPIQTIAAATYALPDSLKQNLRSLALASSSREIELLGATDVALGRFIGESVLSLLKQAGLSVTDVVAIGSHGQTVRHRPQASEPFTLQIGDANQIAERTGCTTVADFRRRDMAAGGQGAPLVPPFHAALFGDASADRIILNIGGMANITHLRPKTPVIGFDTGPGNVLMDDWCLRHQNQSYDANGSWAAGGSVDAGLLARLMRDPYLQLEPPKSTGKEHYNLAWLDQQLAGFDHLAPVDVQATLVEFTAASVAAAVPTSCERIIVCGGGRMNKHLMERLGARCHVVVTTSDELGIDGDSVEAAAFAWLAAQTLARQPGNAPAVTGATGLRVLGAIYPA